MNQEGLMLKLLKGHLFEPGTELVLAQILKLMEKTIFVSIILRLFTQLK